MNIYKSSFIIVWVVLLSVLYNCHAGPLLGRAIIASIRGDVDYVTKENHAKLEKGMALTDGHSIVTKRNADLCAVLTPGAILCVHGGTTVGIEALKHATDGLPKEGESTKGVIDLKVSKGAVLLQAGKQNNKRSIEVGIGSGVKLYADGGRFIIADDKEGKHVFVEEGSARMQYKGKTDTLKKGGSYNINNDNGNKSIKYASKSELPYDFDIYRNLFLSLDPIVADWDGSKLAALNEWLEPSPGIKFVGEAREMQDVSPSVHQHGLVRLHPTIPPAGKQAHGNGQWRRPDIWAWYKGLGTLRGVNYLPRTAVNSIEMWRKDSFDPKTIKQELKWASDSGLDSVRVFLPYVIWKSDADGLKKRMDKFLDIADKFDISTIFVMFDDDQAPGFEPHPWAQPAPVPGVYNSRWVASPGYKLVPKSAGKWPDLKKYIEDIIGSFKNDDRVLMWDLYNSAGRSVMGQNSFPLVNAAFDWARDVAPDQPLTVGIGTFQPEDERLDIMKASDVITLSNYGSPEEMMGMLQLASTRGRPVICTGWLRRNKNNTFKDILPVFSKLGVGWYHWGLVKGKAQLYIPPDNNKQAPYSKDLWAQDLLNEKGEPFDKEEIRLIKGFSFE